MVGYTLLLFLPLLCALPYVNVQLKYINAPDAILLIFIFFSVYHFWLPSILYILQYDINVLGNNEMKFECEFDVAYIEVHISF